MPCGSKEASLAQGILKRDLRLAWHMPPLLSRGIPGDPVERCLPWESPRRRRKPEADLISADPDEKVAGVGRIVFLNQLLAAVACSPIARATAFRCCRVSFFQIMASTPYSPARCKRSHANRANAVISSLWLCALSSSPQRDRSRSARCVSPSAQSYFDVEKHQRAPNLRANFEYGSRTDNRLVLNLDINTD
jgi:hypothetical protein